METGEVFIGKRRGGRCRVSEAYTWAEIVFILVRPILRKVQ